MSYKKPELLKIDLYEMLKISLSCACDAGDDNPYQDGW